MSEFDLSIDEPVASKPEAKQPNWLLIAAIAFGCWWSYSNYQSIPSPSPAPDDEQTIVDPQPIADAWLLIVYESEDNDTNFLSIYGNKSYRDGLAARGLQPYFQDVDACPDEIKTLANGIGLPAVLVFDKAGGGKPITFKLPEGGPTALDAEIKKRVGK